MLTLALVLAAFSLVVVTQLDAPWNVVLGVLAGGAMSLSVSILMQSFASSEQSRMIKAVTLDAEGIRRLPDAFVRVKWMPFATKRPSPEGGEVTQWVAVPLTKIGGCGPRFVTYSLRVPNIIGDLVVYNCTFIGLQGGVVAIITCENESASSILFNIDVPDAGVFFGTAYLTDWFADHRITLAMVGTGDIPNVPDIPPEIATALEHWYNKIHWRIEAAYEGISSHSKNTEENVE